VKARCVEGSGGRSFSAFKKWDLLNLNKPQLKTDNDVKRDV
jgi:hypothetical protein